jgi:hypothetical protein
MSVKLCRSIDTVAGPRGYHATIAVPITGKSARVEIWRGQRRMDTRRCSVARAAERVGELLEFWSADQPT